VNHSFIILMKPLDEQTITDVKPSLPKLLMSEMKTPQGTSTQTYVESPLIFLQQNTCNQRGPSVLGTDTFDRVNACDTPDKHDALKAEFANNVGQNMSSGWPLLMVSVRIESISCPTVI
jgi:hypothetical protein